MSREMTPAEIDQLLGDEVIVRVGCHAEGRTYVVPLTCVYDGESLFGHCGDGMKNRMMRSNPEVCVEVEQIETPAIWKTVIAWGRYEELQGDEAVAAMERLLERLTPTLPPSFQLPPAGVLAREGIAYRIRLSEKTGRAEDRNEVRH